jgi:hypothetical protein
MSWDVIQMLSSGGAGAAVIVLTIVFLRFLKEERQWLMQDRREERREFLEKLECVSNAVGDLNSALRQRPCMLPQTRHDEPDRRSGEASR